VTRRRGGAHRAPATSLDILARLRPLLQGLAPLMRRHRSLFLRGLAFTCALVGTRLLLPLPLTGIVQISAGRPAFLPGWGDPVVLLSVAFVFLALMAGVAEHFQRLDFAHFANRSLTDARAAALARLLEREGDTTEELMAQVMLDSAKVKLGLKGVLNHIILNGLWVLGTCAALAVADVRLGVVQLCGSAITIVLAVVGASRTAALADEHRRGETRLSGVVHDVVRHTGTGNGDDDLNELRSLGAASAEADVRMSRWENRTTVAVHAVLTLTAVLVLTIGIGAVEGGRIGAPVMFSVVAYLLMLHRPGVRLARQITRLGPLLVSANHLGRVLTGDLRGEPRGAARQERSAC
jgi:ABC-type multidrug transport system fused ATPase/permease subunit